MKAFIFLLGICLSSASFANYQIKSTVINFKDGIRVEIQKNDHVRIIDKNNQVLAESWFGANGYQYWPSVKFVKAFQKAVSKDSITQIADMVNYPLKIYNSNIKSIKNKREFKRYYKQIFTSNLKSIIAQTNPYRLFCNSSGVMFGEGASTIWLFKNQADGLKISVINMPR